MPGILFLYVRNLIYIYITILCLLAIKQKVIFSGRCGLSTCVTSDWSVRSVAMTMKSGNRNLIELNDTKKRKYS